MTNIYPFKAITPISGLEYGIHNKFIFHSDKKFDFSTHFYEKKLVYINDLLKQNLLHKHAHENFYCCKISNGYFSVIGLIALVNADLVNKTIFRHERCIDIKEETYLDYFKKYKTQISPIILVHKNNCRIDRSLDNIINKDLPFFAISDDEYKYEIWTVADLTFCKELYSSITSFLIADGHHRVSAINTFGQSKFITAFLTSVSYIKSANIYREYLEVNNLSKKNLLLFLNNNFDLVKDNNINKLSLDKFSFKIDCNIYEIKDSNDHIRRNILEFLDKSINYKNNKLNFLNYSYNKNSDLMVNGSNDISMLIPAFKIMNEIDKLPLYPPHSTLFYPKLPDGLISIKVT